MQKSFSQQLLEKNNPKMTHPEEASPTWEVWGGPGDTEKGSNTNQASGIPVGSDIRV